ncbi:hypothetical protein MMPV_009387 [Pyropia vietnamensis]
MAFVVPLLSHTLRFLPRQPVVRWATARGAGYARGLPPSRSPARVAALPRVTAAPLSTATTPTVTSMAASSPPVPDWDPVAATAEVAAGASFLRCVDIARGLCGALDGTTSGGPAPPSAADVTLLRALLTSSNGARGFFVSYLGDPDVTVADTPPSAAVVDVLTEAVVAAAGSTSGATGGAIADGAVAATSAADAGVVPSLLAKNLVMSNAMVVAYRQEDKTDLAAGTGDHDGGSDGGAAAAAVPAIRSALVSMQTSVLRALDGVRGEAGGEYGPFLVKWGYTDAQLGAMRDALGRVL